MHDQDRQLRSFYRVFEKQVSDELHVQLGYAVSILCASRRASGRQMRFVEHVLVPAFRHRQFALLFDEHDEPAAYVLWASLTVEVEQRIIRTGRLGMHFSEWDEGERTWIIDIAAKPGHLKYVLQHCRDVLFRDREEVRYMRLWRETRQPRHIQRNRLKGCLRSMPPAKLECCCGNRPFSAA